MGIPVITLLTYYLTYNNITLNWLLVYELLSDAIKIFVVWHVIRKVIVELDKRYIWQRGRINRLLRQVPLTCMAGIAVLAVMVYAEYAFIRPYRLEHFFSFDVVIATIFILLGHTIYVGPYYYDLYLHSLTKSRNWPQNSKKRTSGRQPILQ